MRYLIIGSGDRAMEQLYEQMAAQGVQVLRVSRPSAGKLRAIVDFQPDALLVRLPSWGAPAPFMRFLLSLAEFASRPVIALMTEGELQREGRPWQASSVLSAPYSVEQVLSWTSRLVDDVQPSATEVLHFGDVVIDCAARRVEVNSEPVELTFPEFELLVCLARAKGRVLRRDELLRATGVRLAPPKHLRAVDIHVLRLRTKLHHARGLRIETVRRVGYRCDADPIAETEPTTGGRKALSVSSGMPRQ